MTARHQLPKLLGSAMWEKLQLPRNVAKGDAWRDMTFDELWMLLLTEIEELRIAVAKRQREDVRSEVGDVANFLAMILDKVESECSPA